VTTAGTPPALPDFVQPLGDGVHAVDTGFHRPRFDAAYLIVERGRAAFVDTGTAFAVLRLLQALDALGVARDAVDWIIPTHVHLDHAGGVGALAAALPAARVLVHPRGARHLADPAVLWQGATAVYGAEEMARSYGSVTPVPADRLVESRDGMTVELAGRPLLIADTPGHARHHHCVWDEATRGWFTGDTFGISYREFDTADGAWALPSSTPVQFDPPALAGSIERLLATRPEAMYLTHYGRLGRPSRVAAQLQTQIAGMVEIGLRLRGAADRHAALKHALCALYLTSLAEHGWAGTADQATALLALDIELNAQGLAVWLDRGAA
jgi:glyoxylase-like metal-dependent hydrolase (beta-lactamase superfamily II)